MKQPRFEVYESKDGFRWRLLAANNRTIATGEAHTNERDAWRATRTVMDTAVRLNAKALIARHTQYQEITAHGL